MSCYPSTIAESECLLNLVQNVFLPGHQILISTFVKGIKADCNNVGMSGDQLNPAHAKRKEVISAESVVVEEPPNAENYYNLESISNDIRKK